MIINRTEFLERPIKPGAAQRPLKPPETSEPQWAIDRCLDCKIPEWRCKGACEPDGNTQKVPKSRRTELAVLDLINSGVTDKNEIAEKLGVTWQTVHNAQIRLMMKGELKT